MIIKENLLKSADEKSKNAIELFHFGLGKQYDIQLIATKCDDNQWAIIEIQGSDINAVNKLRKESGLHEFNKDGNIQIADPSWGYSMKTGKGIMFVIQKNSFRYKENNDIKSVIAWMHEQLPGIRIEKIANRKYDVFFITFDRKRKEAKKDIDESMNEIEIKTESNEKEI